MVDSTQHPPWVLLPSEDVSPTFDFTTLFSTSLHAKVSFNDARPIVYISPEFMFSMVWCSPPPRFKHGASPLEIAFRGRTWS
ncbi:hypothetical protein F2Q70_00022632 [Brassica cretica]|uniref:Uncharacterized protein n=1 Tax=Brassica cretica TaxID=69181 RepID=A0A8S9GK99_BRACR|nr:hypothetical protein F2Q70_00022632 [Brassica cretica]